MRLPLKRVFDEKRRLMIPVLGGLALNIVLYAAVVYPMSVRARSAESRAAAADAALQAAERDDAAARGVAEGRDRTDVALKAFYNDVLPTSFAQAHAEHLSAPVPARGSAQRPAFADAAPTRFPTSESSLVRLQITTSLQGDYEDLRRFIYQVESGTDFIVIDSVALRQGGEPGSPLTLELALSTYYRARPDGA